MSTNKLNCASCGAAITVPENREFINCPYCTAILAIIRGNGYTAFKVVESATNSLPTLEDLTKKTGQLTPVADQKTAPLSQEQQIQGQIQLAEMQLDNLQAEINALTRVQKSPRGNKEVQRLYIQKFQLLENLRDLNHSQAALGPQDFDSRISALEAEIHWITSELQAIEAASEGESQEAGDVWETTTDRLREYRQKLQIKVSDLNIEKIKAPLASFQVKEVSLRDRTAIEAVLAAIRTDMDRVNKVTQTLEVSLVKDELTGRYQALLRSLNELKREPTSPAYNPLMIPVSSGNSPKEEKDQPNGLRGLFRRKK